MIHSQKHSTFEASFSNFLDYSRTKFLVNRLFLENIGNLSTVAMAEKYYPRGFPGYYGIN